MDKLRRKFIELIKESCDQSSKEAAINLFRELSLYLDIKADEI